MHLILHQFANSEDPIDFSSSIQRTENVSEDLKILHFSEFCQTIYEKPYILQSQYATRPCRFSGLAAIVISRLSQGLGSSRLRTLILIMYVVNNKASVYFFDSGPAKREYHIYNL